MTRLLTSFLTAPGRRFARFGRCEDGATTVDFVVVTAGTAALGIAVLATLGDGAIDTAAKIGAEMELRVVAGQDNGGTSGDISGGTDADAVLVGGQDGPPPSEAEPEAESAQDPGAGPKPEPQEPFWLRLLRAFFGL